MNIFFNKIIKPYILYNNYRSICEIGVSTGRHTDKLLTINSTRIALVDACLDVDLCEKYKQNSRVKVYKGLILDILPRLSEKFDCILIDADPNWYTVYKELGNIEEGGLIRDGGTIFFHDVSWPYGRRDTYYIPESIPEEYRHPFAQKGMIYGISDLSEEPDALNANYFNALQEGGPRNGVLTAIEDFLKMNRGKYYFLILREEYGLGILIKKEQIKIKTIILLSVLFFLEVYFSMKSCFIIKERLRRYRFLFKIKRGFINKIFNLTKDKLKT
jgi:hypothetical protein